jgi:uncharacterized protein
MSGEGRRFELEATLPEFTFGQDTYRVSPVPVPLVLDVSRMTGGGYALRLRFEAALHGPCMRCLEHAVPAYPVDSREVDQPGGGEELTSPYLEDEQLDVQRWAHDAFTLVLPQQILCRPDCAGLCPICGKDLNQDPDHEHETGPDPRWAKLSELKFDES